MIHKINLFQPQCYIISSVGKQFTAVVTLMYESIEKHGNDSVVVVVMVLPAPTFPGDSTLTQFTQHV